LPWTPWEVILGGKDWPAGLILIHDDDDGEGEFFKVLNFTEAQGFILDSASKVNQMVAM
jgi:hypothetical protein